MQDYGTGGFEKLNEFQYTHSDIITYHDYEEANWHQRVIDLLKVGGRPRSVRSIWRVPAIAGLPTYYPC